jgi:MarR family
MNRQELVTLQDAIVTILACPPAVLDEVARWLTAPATKPNGHDYVPTLSTPKAAPTPRPAVSKPQRKHHDNPAHARAAERRLLAVMRDHPGASVEKLAKVVGAGRSTCGERLRRLAAQDLIEKAPDGRWRVKAEESQGEEPGPQQPSPN